MVFKEIFMYLKLIIDGYYYGKSTPNIIFRLLKQEDHQTGTVVKVNYVLQILKQMISSTSFTHCMGNNARNHNWKIIIYSTTQYMKAEIVTQTFSSQKKKEQKQRYMHIISGFPVAREGTEIALKLYEIKNTRTILKSSFMGTSVLCFEMSWFF